MPAAFHYGVCLCARVKKKKKKEKIKKQIWVDFFFVKRYPPKNFYHQN